MPQAGSEAYCPRHDLRAAAFLPQTGDVIASALRYLHPVVRTSRCCPSGRPHEGLPDSYSQGSTLLGKVARGSATFRLYVGRKSGINAEREFRARTKHLQPLLLRVVSTMIAEHPNHKTQGDLALA
jgi:hypothetical protein